MTEISITKITLIPSKPPFFPEKMTEIHLQGMYRSIFQSDSMTMSSDSQNPSSISRDFPEISHGFPMDFPWISHGFPTNFPEISGQSWRSLSRCTLRLSPDLESAGLEMESTELGGLERGENFRPGLAESGFQKVGENAGIFCSYCNI